ncbi:MAG: hypothetical protein KAG56_02320 [Sulfurovaceae bacterium]|nr:hypothetical protein [Sulfurovaceae bacterium]
MDKKLKKYINRYEKIENCLSHELMPNGAMMVLINQETNCEVLIENEVYKLESFQAMLINAYETSVSVQSNENINLTVVRFKGAGASFFYEEEMNELMQVPKKPIFIEKNILENELDSYLKNRLTTSQLPFNIMKIIALLDEKGSNYNIDEVLAIANIPRKVLDKIFSLRTGLSIKTYATLTGLGD